MKDTNTLAKGKSNLSKTKNRTGIQCKIFVAEDDDATFKLIHKKLQREGIHLERARTGSEAIEKLPEGSTKLLLLDYQLPDMTGEDVIETLAEQGRCIPFIVMTAHGSEKIAVKMMKLGARDYLVKEEGLGDLLPIRIANVLEQLETEWKLNNAEVALRESEANYCSLFENMLSGFAYHEILLDEKGQPCDYVFLEVNAAFESLTGLRKDEVVGKRVTEILPEIKDLDFDWIGRYGKVALTGKAIRFDHYFVPLGRWYSITAYSSMKGYFATTFEDITERKRLETALRESEERHRELVEQMPDGFYRSTPDGKFIMVNHAFVNMLGYDSKAEVMDLEIPRDLYFSPEERKRALESLNQEGCPETTILRLKKKGGDELWGEDHGQFVCDREGKVLYYEGVIRDITERKRAEQALKESEEKYRKLIESANDAIFIADTKTGIILDVNKKAEKLLGLATEEIIGMHQTQLHPPEQVERYKSIFSEHIGSGGATISDNIFVCHKDGLQIPVEISASITEVNGKEIIQGVFRDITERKQAEEQLSKLSIAVEQSPASVVITDTQGNIEYVNPKFTEVTGYTYDEVMGKNPRILKSGEIPPEEYKKLWDTITCGNEWKGEFHNKKKNGEFFWESASISPIRNTRGITTHFLAVKEDITERKETEEALRKAHAETEQLLSSISSILIGVGADNRITRWNATAEKIFGIMAPAVVGNSFSKCEIPWDWQAIQDCMAKCQEDDDPGHLNEMRYTQPDGKEGFLSLTVNPIKNDNKEDAGYLFLGTEITERKVLESQLAQAQKLESIGQLAAGIAHEINTPTQYVGDNTRFLQIGFERLRNALTKHDALLKAAKEDAVTEELITEVESAIDENKIVYIAEEIPMAIEETLDGVDRVANIVRAMKEYAHPGVEEMTLTDINKALENTITVARNEWKYVAELVKDFDPSLPLVPCLPGELNQVFLNMIVNAAHAIADLMEDGSNSKGVITISTGWVNDWVEIRISDSGSGIPEEVRSKIFDPFFTTKEAGKGSGQGLAISHNVIVEKHSGSITFETEVDKGTTFIIRLPINSSKPRNANINEETNIIC